MKYLKDIDLENKRVLIRADLNVPLNEALEITDDNRIKQFIPTVQYVLEKKGRPILMSHLGSPEGKVNPKESLRPIAKKLQELGKFDVVLASDCTGPEVAELARTLEPGRVLLLENLRFNPGEESNDTQFAQQLANL